MLFNIPGFFETDPAKKDMEWANRMITNYRIKWDHLINPLRAKTNMSILFGTQDLGYARDMFVDPDKSGVDFNPVRVFEKIRNILVSEVDNAGIKLMLNAIDPTASTQKLRDRELLANRSDIEEFLSYLRQTIGLPPYKLSDEKARSGKEVFSGNVKEFDQMGLSEGSQQDLDYFFATYYRLTHEIKGEEAIRQFVAYNELDRTLPLLCNDILAKKAIAFQTYVNESNGSITAERIAPENVKLIMGKNPDGKDAQCIGFERMMSVSEFISHVGGEFDFEADLPYLLMAVNFGNTKEYTGVRADGNMWFGNEGNTLSHTEFMYSNVSVGYIEFKSQDAKSIKKTTANYYGNPAVKFVPLDSKSEKESIYTRETLYNEVIYKAIFLSLGTGQQKLYKWGKLPYMNTKGAQDEYAGYSISMYKDVGPTATEVVEKYIRILHKATAKYEWLINKAKAPGRLYNFDALIEVATKMIGSGNTQSDVLSIVKLFAETENEMYTTPTIDGSPVGGNGQPHFDLPHGLSKAVLEFKQIIEQCIEDINNNLGISPVRDAYAPQERDVYKLQMQSLNSSRNATGYIPRMLSYLFVDVGVKMLFYMQDIIKFKSKAPLAYDFLITLLGEQTTDDIDALDNVAYHRYGIIVEGFNTKFDSEEFKMLVQKALESGQIDFEQFLLIRSIESPKRAAMTLAYMKNINEQKAQKAQAQKAQMDMQVEAMKHKNKMEEIQLEGQLRNQGMDIRGKYEMLGHQTAADAKLEVNDKKIQAEIPKIDAKKEAKIEEAEVQGGQKPNLV